MTTQIAATVTAFCILVSSCVGYSPGRETPGIGPDGISPTPSPTSSPTGTRPAETERPVSRRSPDRPTLPGTATWYRSPINVAAAGSELRAAIGPGWRGTRVRVCAGAVCVRTVLGDWCGCPGARIIDLDDGTFRRLAPLSRGVLKVKVSW